MLLLVMLTAFVGFSGIYLLYRKSRQRCIWDEPIFSVLIFGMAVVSLLIAIIMIPISRLDDRVFATKVAALQQTLDNARETADGELGNALERTRILADIAEINTSLARRLYYANSPWLSLWFDGEALKNIKPVR